MTEGFTTKVVADGIWYIQDSSGCVMYLVAGQERALLIDTGWGTGDLSAFVKTLTPLPVLVVNTHGHRDHTAGNDQFAEVYIHTADLPLVEESEAKLIPIYDGYAFDLGDREIRVIGVPGHSPGSICLLDRKARVLFSGDSPRPGPIWMHFETCLTVHELHRSFLRLRTFADDFDIIAPAHGEPQPIGSLLDDLIHCAGGIVSGEIEGQPEETRLGTGLMGKYGSAKIMYRADRVQWSFAGMFRDRLVSPEVHADRTVTFRVKAPNCKSIVLQSGSILNALGSADSAIGFCERDEASVWSLTLGPLPPDIYDYTFRIDGVSSIDNNNPAVKTGTSSPQSLLTVPTGGEPGFHDARDVPHGTLHRHYYASKTLGDVRDVYVYTPPGYETNPALEYPVLYLLHGGGDDAGGWSQAGRVHLIMDNLLAEGKAKPTIVVMPFGQAVPRSASFEDLRTKNTPLFEQDLFADVLPLVESTYRVQADRKHRAMAGLSMGGGQTAAVTMANLDKFSHIGLFSGGAAIPRAGRDGSPPAPFDIKTAYNGAMADPAEFNRTVKVLFMSFGTEPPLENPEGLNKHQEQLIAAGITNSYVYLSPGTSHEWQTWRRSLYTFAQLLFR